MIALSYLPLPANLASQLRFTIQSVLKIHSLTMIRFSVGPSAAESPTRFSTHLTGLDRNIRKHRSREDLAK